MYVVGREGKICEIRLDGELEGIVLKGLPFAL